MRSDEKRGSETLEEMRREARWEEIGGVGEERREERGEERRDETRRCERKRGEER